MKFVIIGLLSLAAAYTDASTESVKPAIAIAKPSCGLYCTLEYMPFCALPENGCGEPITFTNKCQFDKHNCENSSNVYKIYDSSPCADINKKFQPISAVDPIIYPDAGSGTVPVTVKQI